MGNNVGAPGELEIQTIWRVLRGESLARFGDGELKLCHGADSLTQAHAEWIGAELRMILRSSACLVGVPHARGARSGYWKKFLRQHGRYLVKGKDYGSAFVSRPDEVPAIDTLSYRRLVRGLWEGRNVFLVTGGGSLDENIMREARSVQIADVPEKHACSFVDRVCSFGISADIVILCCGAAGTILAHRLASEGYWAVDMGYIGRFL